MITSRNPVTGAVRLPATLVILLAAAMFLFAGMALAQGPDPDRFIVQFAESGNSDAARHAIARAGGQVLLEIPGANAAAARIPAHALQGLRKNPNIQLIEQDAPRFPMAQVTPYGVPMVLDGLNAAPTGKVLVCVIDSGIDAGHPDFAGATLSGTHVAKSGGGTNAWNTDTCGHGTHVAGTIVAQNNDIGVVGVAPGIRVHSIKVFDGAECGWTYASSTINAAYLCRDAGDTHQSKVVINMSLGCVDSGRGGIWACATSTENNGFQDLYDNFGVLSIAASGNAGTTQKSYPASYASVVSVAAIDSNKVVADFSQKNDAVELSAPGVGVLSTVPRGMGTTAGVTVNGTAYNADGMDGSVAGNVLDKGIVNCGLGTAVCSGATDKICLIERGQVSFADKVLNCQGGGGLAAVIYNNEPGPLYGTLGGVATTIPSVGISQADGHTILSLSSPTGSVVVAASDYDSYNGTSMATPHVAGVAALVWAHDPSWSNAQIRTALQSTAQDLGPSGRDNSYGFGLVRANAALVALGGGGSEPPPQNQPPVASFTYSCVDLTCNFNDTSTDSDGSIASRAWAFGDGATSTATNPTRTYGAGGTYTVTLTVTDNEGATGTTSQSVTVAAPATGGIALTVNAYKVQGLQKADLSWNGASSSTVDVYRNNLKIASPDNTGAWTDNINVRGGGSYTYRVCDAGADTCSPDVTASF
jgi:serine protease